MTNTDISMACERKKITAPVTNTLAKPSASGSDAAASEPNTASRIRNTIGNPVVSAASRSSFDSSCMPAQSACCPTRCGSTPCARLSHVEFVAHVDRHVRELVLTALQLERDHDDRLIARLRLGAGGRLAGQLDVAHVGGDPIDPVDLLAHGGGGRALALRKHHGQRLALGLVEVGRAPRRPSPTRSPGRGSRRWSGARSAGRRTGAAATSTSSHVMRTKRRWRERKSCRRAM